MYTIDKKSRKKWKPLSYLGTHRKNPVNVHLFRFFYVCVYIISMCMQTSKYGFFFIFLWCPSVSFPTCLSFHLPLFLSPPLSSPPCLPLPPHPSFLSKPTWEILKYCSATCLFHPITSRYASLDLRGTNPTVGVLLLPTDMTWVLNYFWWMVLWAGGGGGGHSTSPPTPPRHCWSVVGMRSSLRPNTSSCTDLSWPAGTNSRLGGRKGALSQSSSA